MRYRFLRYPNGLEKALTLSYDDGNVADKKLIEIADKYGIKVTLNINCPIEGREGNGWNLSGEELKRLIEKGNHEIAVHGAYHIAPGNATAVNGIRDVLDCRIGLEREFGKIIRGMAYPDTGITKISSGVSKEEIKQYLKQLGIAYSRTLGGDNNNFLLPRDFYEWMPTAHHKNENLMKWWDEFANTPLNDYISKREPKLFYLWGHSFEFQNNNWEIFEEFCKTAGGREDIWYATNIEICDYVNAYYSLKFNVDNTLVYNPTSTKIWFEADGKTFSVAAGETKGI